MNCAPETSARTLTLQGPVQPSQATCENEGKPTLVPEQFCKSCSDSSAEEALEFARQARQAGRMLEAHTTRLSPKAGCNCSGVCAPYTSWRLRGVRTRRRRCRATALQAFRPAGPGALLTRSCHLCRPGVLRTPSGLLERWMPPSQSACFTCRRVGSDSQRACRVGRWAHWRWRKAAPADKVQRDRACVSCMGRSAHPRDGPVAVGGYAVAAATAEEHLRGCTTTCSAASKLSLS